MQFAIPALRLRLALLIVALALSFAAVAASRRRAAPEALACRFVAGWRARDLAALHPLLDDSYRRVFGPHQTRELVAELARDPLPPCRVEMAGHPNAAGVVSDWNLFYVRFARDGPPAADRDDAFVVTLVRGTAGDWRVAFFPTCGALVGVIDGPAGERRLREALWRRAGAQARGLLGWGRELATLPRYRPPEGSGPR